MILLTNELSKYLSEFFNNYLQLQKNVSINTIKSYKKTMELYFKYLIENKEITLGKLNLDHFSKKLILDFLMYLENDRKNSINTRNQRLAAISTFVKYLYPNEINRALQFQQVLDIPVKKLEDKPKQYLTSEEMKLFLQQPDIKTKQGRRDLTLIATLYDTGARVSEIINLTVSDIRLDGENSTIRVLGKGNKIRVIPIIGNTTKLLERYLKENHLTDKLNNLVFYNNRKEKLTEPGIKYILEKYRKKAKEQNKLFPDNIFAHMLRHSKAMHLLEAGVSYIYIRDFLGHSDIKTTETYAKINTEMKRKVLSEVYEKDMVPESKSSWQKDENLLEYLMNLSK